MSDPFEQLFDPRARAEADAPAPPRSDRPEATANLGRGIPEVTRPRSRLALPAMIFAATLVTGGFVYSVGSAHQSGAAPAIVEVDRPPVGSPPAPPGVEPVEVKREPVPDRQTSPAHAVAPDAVAAARTEARRRAAERLRSPLLVTGGASAAIDDGAVRLASGNSTSDANSSFLASASERVVPTARARVLPNQGALIAQGTLVAGVLETAINSDLPGLLRAVVAADVTAFDGRRVLIPRGSRLIGEYRSGIAIGQTRAFIVWTRLITPAGISIELGSPGTDALGRAGLTGRVDEHFFKRFGAALLLSVVGSAGQVAANAASSGDALTINAASDAGRVAELALQNRVNIPPTIKVRQGTPIRIFVARDLDFGGTESAAAGDGVTGG
jgi:type IV secretion system protein VirB10